MRARLAAVLIALIAPLVVTSTASAGCYFLNASACPTPPVKNPAARTPGQPVAQVAQVNKATGASKNPYRSSVRSTQVLGVPDPGVVPVVGDVGAKADDGSYVMYESRVDDRMIDLMVWSAGLLGPAAVRIQLPPSWGTDPARRYPGLFLLHGGNDVADYQCWSVYSQFKERVGDLDALVVMPSSGIGGHTTNYTNFGFRSGKQYQTFVTTELWQILQRGYKLGDKAAVAGASSGARSAYEVAYKNPTKFVAAAAYSGLLDTQAIAIPQVLTLGPIFAQQTPLEMWGDPILNASTWNDRNPAKNLSRLKGIKLYAYAANGRRDAAEVIPSNPIEPVVNFSTREFLSAAKRAGVEVTANVDGFGYHGWPVFDAAFGESLPLLDGALGLPTQAQPGPIPQT